MSDTAILRAARAYGQACAEEIRMLMRGEVDEEDIAEGTGNTACEVTWSALCDVIRVERPAQDER